MSGTSGRASLAQPPLAKTVLVYRNGDPFFPGRKIVVSQRRTSTFDGFLSSVTRGVEAPFGAVRNVYTPREGHKIVALEQLQHGDEYVAAGAERFKKLDYCQITPKKPQRKKSEMIRPVVHSKLAVSARWKKSINEPCTINVFTNGNILAPPVRILIPKYTLRSWENVLAMVTEKVHLRTGAVHRICTLNGTPLLGSAELENDQYYVAVGAEKFRFLPYFHWITKKGRGVDKSQRVFDDFHPSTRKYRNAEAMLNGRRDPSPEGGQERRVLLKTHWASLFYTRPERTTQQIAKGPRLLSTGGIAASEENANSEHRHADWRVFKAKGVRSEVAGATVVQEDGGTMAELPLDQTKAEVVDEEQDRHETSWPGSDALKQPVTPSAQRAVAECSTTASGNTATASKESQRPSTGVRTKPAPASEPET
ncbi:doublecortin domain-containing protein 2 [Brienomyrus brachyistius]|uniref:doublecortin domain-containing protein 2 n=1 Tax=Brienomyrus brachyistius TaxID=42636 RepID=UPI0020B44A07|nr:doublecortin domain-containing protein 2 [Brienomyrus brachyistius]